MQETPRFFNPEVQSNQKPTVILIGDGEDLHTGLEYKEDDDIVYLKNSLECQVLSLSDYDFFHRTQEREFLSKTGSVVSFLVKEGQYDENYSDFPQAIFDDIRKYSTDTPIFFIPYNRWETSKFDHLNDGDPSILVKSRVEDISELIKVQIEKFKRRPPLFGVESIGALQPMTGRILRSYENSDHDNGASPSNDQTIIQALKIHLSPTETIKAIFEDNLNVDNSSYLELIKADIDSETLKAEKQRIKNYSKEERENLVHLVYDSRNYDSQGNYIRCVVGRGDFTKGLAIDPNTLTLILTGSGGHGQERKILAGQILSLERSQGKKYSSYDKERDHEYEIMHRFVSGFIYPHVNGFSSPILITNYFDYWEDRYKKVMSFLMDQSFIVIDEGGRLVDGSFPNF